MQAMMTAILPSLLVGLFLAFSNRRQAKRDKLVDARAEARKQESLLSMELQFATSKLSYATAMALKRGHANGEVEDGITAYMEAKKKYTDFLNAQATERLEGQT